MPDSPDRELFARSMEIFSELLGLPVTEREVHLARACDGDPELRAEVEALLEAEQTKDGLLGAPGPGQALRARTDEVTSPRLPSAAPHAIGPYRLHRVLGEGGMGTVYEAEQERPRRRVALKLLQGRLGSEAACRRFEREAEFLGQLGHPGIAQVFESGLHRDVHGGSIPWIAMELVEGRTIREHADADRLDRRERIGLILQACEAVSHAHARGIVHRDLKPDNILVDESGRVRVLDFGIARAMNEPDDATTRLTMVGDVVGTLSYMSPEQACGRSDDVDERSDVYSLGVVAYELLSGHLPHDLRDLPLADALGHIRDLEADSLGATGGAEAGDLDVIVAKALEKDSDRRYASVADLAADLRRYLRHEPIEARAPSATYRFKRLVRRHRMLALALLGVFATLVAAVVVSTRFALSEATERRRADETARKAIEREQEALRAQYRAQLSAAGAAVERGESSAAGRLLDEAPEGHRGWEWKQLRSTLEDSVARWQAPAGLPVGLVLESGAGGLVVATETAVESLSLPGCETRWSWRAPEGSEVVALSPDGTRALVLREGEVDLLTPATGASTRIATGTTGRAEFSIDGGVAWALAREAGGLESVTIADARSGVVLSRTQLSDVERRWIAVTEGFIVSSTKEPGLLVRETTRDGALRHHDGPTVGSGWIGPLGKRVFGKTAHESGRTVTWDLRSGRLLPWADVGEDLAGIHHISLDESETLLALVHANGLARLVDGRSGRPIAVIAQSDPGGWTLAPAIHEEAGLVVAEGAHHALVVASTNDGTVLRRLRGHGRAIRTAVFSPDGQLLASLDMNGVLRLWDLSVLEDAAVLLGHESYVYDVAISPDGRRVATAAWDGTTRLWDLASGQGLATLTTPSRQPYYGKVAWSSDGRRLAVVHGRTTALWDAVTGGLLGTRRLVDSDRMATPMDEPSGVAWHPSGELFVVGSVGRFVQAHVVGGASGLPEAEQWPMRGESLAFSPDGRLLAVTVKTSVELWDLETQARVARHDQPTSRLRKVVFSPDGASVAAVSDDSHLRVWSVSAGELLVEVKAHGDQAHGMAWSPDGTRLATGGSDRVIRIWDATTGDRLASLSGHERYVYALAWSPDGRVLVSGSGDATVRLWDSEPRGERLMRRRERARLRDSVMPAVRAALRTASAEAAADELGSRPDWSEAERWVALDLVLELTSAEAQEAR
ncbi:MAG: protein kinase [Acidobacteriota bacterium]